MSKNREFDEIRNKNAVFVQLFCRHVRKKYFNARNKICLYRNSDTFLLINSREIAKNIQKREFKEC